MPRGEARYDDRGRSPRRVLVPPGPSSVATTRPPVPKMIHRPLERASSRRCIRHAQIAQHEHRTTRCRGRLRGYQSTRPRDRRRPAFLRRPRQARAALESDDHRTSLERSASPVALDKSNRRAILQVQRGDVPRDRSQAAARQPVVERRDFAPATGRASAARLAARPTASRTAIAPGRCARASCVATESYSRRAAYAARGTPRGPGDLRRCGAADWPRRSFRRRTVRGLLCMGHQSTDRERAVIEQRGRKRAAEVLFAGEQQLNEGNGIESKAEWPQIEIVVKLTGRGVEVTARCRAVRRQSRATLPIFPSPSTHRKSPPRSSECARPRLAGSRMQAP